MQPVFSRSVFRFAPSPNGYLHLGHAFSALENACAAREAGGRFLVRIEDIDVQRCRDDLVEACFDDLAWLGLTWEQPVLRQSQHFARYAEAIEVLDGQHLLYPCFCTRGAIAKTAQNAPLDPDGSPLYPGTCRALTSSQQDERFASGMPYALRLDMLKALAKVGSPLNWQESGTVHPADPVLWGDVVLKRKDVPTSYHLSVVLDDAFQGVTHVIRGRDLFEATAIHRVLQAILGLPAPNYRHHRLILGEDGKKLSKSLASTPIRQMRGEGMTALQMLALLGFSNAD